ncbi:dethiobiotin synthase [uncultured Legionella sp.]|uniref:dethiobiotin synthase n=1 Tax=uncultured Legionella sp. TaxID=210934 RepID=UPI002638135B|nr:dethiobiotin synthase [uncultured Legionella sp.]
MKRYFITGTDTDCGKTYVTRKLTEFVPNSAAIKPVASGCTFIDGELISSDAQELMHTSTLTMQQINPWRFKLPVSPHIAAKQDGTHLSADELAQYCTRLELPQTDTLFIEGAGGLMVPLNEEETWLDFLKCTEIPIILVVGMKLGCINHALLTSLVLKSNKLSCAGWIANCLDKDMLALEENIQTLKSKLDIPLLATVPFGGTFTVINFDCF